MATAVKISDDLVRKAKIRSKVFKRSIAGQIEYWAKIGEIVEENQDLPFYFIQNILLGKEQIRAGEGTPYKTPSIFMHLAFMKIFIVNAKCIKIEGVLCIWRS